MESPPSDDDFEHVEYEQDFAGCTDDEYEFVEAPAAATQAQPVGGGVIASNEYDDDHDGSGDNEVFSPPGPETIIGCDQGNPTKTIVQVIPPPPPHIAVAPAKSSSPPPPTTNADAEEKMASPFSPCDVAAAQDAAMPIQAPRYDLVHMAWDVAEIFAAPASRRYVAGDCDAEQYDDEDTDDEYDGGLYGYYDYADFGRARRVKRSSGRRGRTKKASAMGRPRGEARSSQIAGNY